MKLLFDESLSPRLVSLLGELFPKSESALWNGLAKSGDRHILQYALESGFVLVTTDRDFESLVNEARRNQVSPARVVILRKCNYPTETVVEVLRRNAIRIAALSESSDTVLVLDR